MILAALMHALLLTRLSFQANTLITSAPPFEVSILRPLQTASVIAETKTLKNPYHAFDKKIKHQDKSDTFTNKPPAKIIASTEQLLASARIIALAEAKKIANKNTDSTQLADRAYSTEIDQVLAQKKKPEAGVTQYASGMIKIVSAYGTEYCVQPSTLPTAAFQSESIPMTCP